MKIITKDNFDRDYQEEALVAENVSESIGKELVEEWNRRYWTDSSDFFLILVEDDYELYNGWEDLI